MGGDVKEALVIDLAALPELLEHVERGEGPAGAGELGERLPDAPMERVTEGVAAEL